MEAGVESTLFIARKVDVYKIPPRSGSDGFRCSEWRVDSKIWGGRCRVVERDGEAVVKLEDSNTGDLFAEAPIPSGQTAVVVEPVADSSRYFVLRVADGKKHAFLGMGFEERSTSFDFNVALSDHERRSQREKIPEPGSRVSPDLSLKEGDTINIRCFGGKKTERALSSSKGVSPAAFKLAPPPHGDNTPTPTPTDTAPVSVPSNAGWATFD